MRRFDKLKHIQNANKKLEERHLKESLNEDRDYDDVFGRLGDALRPTNDDPTYDAVSDELGDKDLTTEGPERGKYSDLFYFIENDPKKGSIASVFYTSPVAMNKFVIINGEKQLNPMRGLIYKNSKINFRWEDTYKKAVDRTNPEHEMGARSGKFEKIQGYDILETGKNGLYLPVLPLGAENLGYMKMSENGTLEPISTEEVKPYFKEYKSYGSKSGVNFRLLLVDRINKIRAVGNDWNNPHFEFNL